MVRVLYSCSKKYTAVLELLQIIYLLTLLRESEARSRSQPSQKVRVDPAPPHCTPDAYAPWALPTREAGRLSAVRAVMCIRVFSSISGPHPLNNRSIPHPQRDSQKCLQTWPSVPHLRATSVDLAATAWGFRTPCWLNRLQKAVQPRTVLPRFHASPPVGSVGIVVSISRGPQHLPTKYALTPNPPHASPASVAPRGGTQPWVPAARRAGGRGTACSAAPRRCSPSPPPPPATAGTRPSPSGNAYAPRSPAPGGSLGPVGGRRVTHWP